ncbi:MAG: 3-oxoacyl-ACP reductase FabG [Spirochaetaceae bacterium]|nr:3-oxoacyl-ACP reductase FabG [Spirochaetaceae bacterium]
MIQIDLTGKTAIITGASQGLGASTARRLYEAGANITINYFEDSKGINKENARILAESLGSRAIYIAADVTDIEDVEAMFQTTIKQFGTVDIVVNNAGIVRDRTAKKMSEEEWKSVIDTNLTGVFHVCKTAAGKLADGGRIVNLSSISGQIGLFGQCNYAAAKAGVMGLTKVIAKEVSRREITVNAVAPGVVLTEMGLSIPESVRDEMLKNIPLNRFGDPQEISNVILFLCSELSSYMTGQILQVNGGWI